MCSLIRLCSLLMVFCLGSAPSQTFAKDSSSIHSIQTSSAMQLATAYHDVIVVADYWVSEKLDGIRARWNGVVFTSRSGKTIVAPSWFTQGFPQQVLEGELWLAHNSFEQTASVVLRDTPNQEWQNIKFMLFDLPAHKGTFSQRLTELGHLIDTANNPYLQLIPQFKVTSHAELMLKLDEVVAQGAEGLMLHHQDAYYQDGRSTRLLKLKKYQDAEAKVIAHIIGKGKYKSMMGSLLVELDNGLQFKIGSGFSDLQRLEPPQVGTIISFKYYGLTARGIPRFASFLRVKPMAELETD